MVYDNDHYHASALLHNKKKGAADALHPSRHVVTLNLCH
ncbi:hypothetical protein T01_11989 [Trichinella spiralis]|uniref:Uncharacterized protein n=1 Tax=Trichinella spiralis TaxID=6334 RepID=A0A0V1BHE9_TRISP|nr:hypothetical protein T01_11989 [Trichinella spiralis]